MAKVTIDQLVTDPHARLELSIRTGRGGLDRAVTVPRIQKPGLALAGYREQLHADRLLVLGGTEVEYWAKVDSAQRAVGVARCSRDPAASWSRGLEPPDRLVRACEKKQVPLLVNGWSAPSSRPGHQYLTARCRPEPQCSVLLGVPRGASAAGSQRHRQKRDRAGPGVARPPPGRRHMEHPHAPNRL